MPPTLAAAKITAFGFVFFKKASTFFDQINQDYFLFFVIIFVNFFFRTLKIADPTKPLCPAKNILSFFII